MDRIGPLNSQPVTGRLNDEVERALADRGVLYATVRALVEAECMRRVLPPGEFALWFDGFLPRLGAGEPATLFTPAAVSDRTDGKIAHLDGLNLSRAWCWRALAGSLGTDDPRRARALAAADRHLAAALPHVAGDYMGEHWLASFAVYLLGIPK